MADSINNFVDNLQLNALNSLTHLLNTEDTDELNIIRHSPYMSDDELIQSRLHYRNGLSILSLNCQSLQAKRTTMEISRIYLLFVQSLAIYVIMFNLESLYCILLNKIKSNQKIILKCLLISSVIVTIPFK